MASRAYQKQSALILLASLIGNQVIPWALSGMYPDYEIKHMILSTLGEPDSPVRWWYQLWLIVFGVLIVIGSKVVFEHLNKAGNKFAGLIRALFIGYGVGTGIIAGFVPLSAKGVTLPLDPLSAVHMFGTILGYLCLMLSLIFLAISYLLKRDYLVMALVVLTMVVAGVYAVLFIGKVPELLAGGTVTGSPGEWQRLSAAVACLPYFVLANKNLESEPHAPSLSGKMNVERRKKKK